LGKGNFGKVYLAEHRTTKEKVAIKVVDKRAFQKSDQIQHAESEQSLCEAFATRMKHKHIVDVHEVIADDHSIYIVMEYMQGGDLFEQIRQSAYIAEPVARRWFREIMEAVHFIHSHGIVHRDLKPENVLIDKRQHLRLCDFGFGKKVAMQQQVLKTYCGSPFYASPEMVTATPYKGPPVDMWSCGVILYLMLTGTLPFQASNMGQLFRKISVAQYTIPRSVSPDASNLIHRLLCKNSRERITAIQCLQHPWL
ncbi:kinase-like domain-containing protein, partial [Radiomyces spectabilis]|uniref:kinase-like domain-containing protein n=1 Tax=Radiomyces spectabilis TaxID=64574 RepID=UPI00221E8145